MVAINQDLGSAINSRPATQPMPQQQADPMAGLQGIIDTQQTTLEGLESEVTQLAMVLQEVIGAYTEMAKMTQAIMMALEGQGQPQEQMPPQQMPPQQMPQGV